MNIEKWIIAHFSPTGGTKKVADAIAAGFCALAEEMDLTKEDSSVTLGENDALMAVLPVTQAMCLRFLWSVCLR